MLWSDVLLIQSAFIMGWAQIRCRCVENDKKVDVMSAVDIPTNPQVLLLWKMMFLLFILG